MRGRKREEGGKEGEESLLMLLEGGKVAEEICWLYMLSFSVISLLL